MLNKYLNTKVLYLHIFFFLLNDKYLLKIFALFHVSWLKMFVFISQWSCVVYVSREKYESKLKRDLTFDFYIMKITVIMIHALMFKLSLRKCNLNINSTLKQRK